MIVKRLLAGLVALGIGCCVIARDEAPSPPVVTITEADALIVPDGLPPRQQRVELRHRWDNAFPARGGHVVYTLSLPPAPSTEPMALLFERVGNQATMQVDGTTVQQYGAPDDTRLDAGKSPHMVVLPNGLLSVDSPNVLLVDVTMQPMRLGGLSLVHFGPLRDIRPMFARMQLLDQATSAAYAASLLLMGAMAAGLWWRQRDRLYGIFSLAAVFGVLRHLDHISIAQPMPWPAWGGVLAVCAGIHLGLVAYFSLLILQKDSPRLDRLFRVAIVAVVALAALAFGLLLPTLWTIAFVLLELLGLLVFAIVLREAVRTRQLFPWLVVGALGLLVLAGLHDIVLVRLGWFGGANVGLTPHAMFVLVCLLAGLVVARYSRTVDDFRALNEHLAERIAEREAQLREAFETMRVQQQDQAVMAERQRIMREIHDGIGSQLVGMLNMLDQAHVDRGALEREIRLALDEMRMAVDSLQPVDRDLTVVLATLRYRLQPRLEAAHLAVVWDVGQLPPIEDLLPPSIFQLQRILLEAFTNVLKHARATRVALQARWQDGETSSGVVLRISDDGVGCAPGAPGFEAQGGRGLANMRARAAAIGATLRIEAAEGGGTCVVVEWPVRLRQEDTPPPAESEARAEPESTSAQGEGAPLPAGAMSRLSPSNP
jgi:signal transduction histidine kinase